MHSYFNLVKSHETLFQTNVVGLCSLFASSGKIQYSEYAQSESRASGVGPSQNESRFLVLTNRSANSGGENHPSLSSVSLISFDSVTYLSATISIFSNRNIAPRTTRQWHIAPLSPRGPAVKRLHCIE